MKFSKGQRVKLNAKGIYKLSNWRHGQRKHKIVWAERTGTVHILCQDKKHMQVQWDGNKARSMALPLTLFEPIGE
jgi:hypothetical protein